MYFVKKKKNNLKNALRNYIFCIYSVRTNVIGRTVTIIIHFRNMNMYYITILPLKFQSPNVISQSSCYNLAHGNIPRIRRFFIRHR